MESVGSTAGRRRGCGGQRGQRRERRPAGGHQRRAGRQGRDGERRLDGGQRRGCGGQRGQRRERCDGWPGDWLIAAPAQERYTVTPSSLQFTAVRGTTSPNLGDPPAALRVRTGTTAS